MKLLLYEGSDVAETEIDVRCRTVDMRLGQLLQYIRQFSFSMGGKVNNASYNLPLEQIFYIDSADGRSFLYCNKNVYERKETLAALEIKLRNTTFVRISKNCILNITYLDCISPMWNHRLEAVLTNGEKLVVSRTYIDRLKEKIMN